MYLEISGKSCFGACSQKYFFLINLYGKNRVCRVRELWELHVAQNNGGYALVRFYNELKFMWLFFF